MSRGQTGFVPGTKWVCPRDKPRFSPFFTQWKPSLSLGQTQFVPGTFRGRRAAERVYVLKVYVPFSFPSFRQEKRAQRLTFWVRRPPGGVGVFHAKGWGSKSSCPPSKVCLPWVSNGGIWDIPGFLPGCPGPLAVFEKFVQKKVRAHFSFPSVVMAGPVLVSLVLWLTLAVASQRPLQQPQDTDDSTCNAFTPRWFYACSVFW